LTGPADSQPQAAAPERPSSAVHEVVAIRYGTLRSRRSELFYRYGTYGEADAEMEMAYFFWVLRAGAQTILVDTGFHPRSGRRRGRTTLCPPVEALARCGVEPAGVTAVIVTHLHYDHVGNLDAFPAAVLAVPRRELEFWSGPLAGRRQFAALAEPAALPAIERAQHEGRLRLTDGVEELFDGITVHTVGGHSPGQQIAVVAAARGEVVLVSDAAHFYEELELDRPFGVIADLGLMYEGYDRIRELGAAPGAIVVPGHDGDVLARFPALAGDPDGNAVRIA